MVVDNIHHTLRDELSNNSNVQLSADFLKLEIYLPDLFGRISRLYWFLQNIANESFKTFPQNRFGEVGSNAVFSIVNVMRINTMNKHITINNLINEAMHKKKFFFKTMKYFKIFVLFLVIYFSLQMNRKYGLYWMYDINVFGCVCAADCLCVACL